MDSRLPELDRRYSLRAAVERFDELRTKELIGYRYSRPPSLTRAEVLELLALTELIARKAAWDRQLTIRTARQAGASWAEIGEWMGVIPKAVWESHQRWIDEQAARAADGSSEFDEAEARAVAGQVWD
jgi:hypothetical protein